MISREGLNIAAAGIVKSSTALDEVKPPQSAGSRQLRSSIAHSEKCSVVKVKRQRRFQAVISAPDPVRENAVLTLEMQIGSLWPKCVLANWGAKKLATKETGH